MFLWPRKKDIGLVAEGTRAAQSTCIRGWKCSFRGGRWRLCGCSSRNCQTVRGHTCRQSSCCREAVMRGARWQGQSTSDKRSGHGNTHSQCASQGGQLLRPDAGRLTPLQARRCSTHKLAPQESRQASDRHMHVLDCCGGIACPCLAWPTAAMRSPTPKPDPEIPWAQTTQHTTLHQQHHQAGQPCIAVL